MAAVMIGVDPHEGSHTAVVISGTGEALGELRVRACAGQPERLLAWAAAWPKRGRQFPADYRRWRSYQVHLHACSKCRPMLAAGYG
jgi:hypothetical protein